MVVPANKMPLLTNPGGTTSVSTYTAAATGASFLLNSPYGPEEVWDHLPRTVQEKIIGKKLRFYVIDAYAVASEIPIGEAPALRSPVRMLVLRNGRVVDGSISQNPGGYMLEKPNGRMLIPFDLVRFEAKDLLDAYEKLLATMPERTSGASNCFLK